MPSTHSFPNLVEVCAASQSCGTTNMADDELPPDWEAVEDDQGRTYWWNVETNETTWTKPQAVVATKEVAAGAFSVMPTASSHFLDNVAVLLFLPQGMCRVPLARRRPPEVVARKLSLRRFALSRASAISPPGNLFACIVRSTA